MIILLIALAVVLLLGGGGLIYYSAVFHPAQLHMQATATAQTMLTVQAQGTAAAHAQATGTAQAIANATATVQAQATAQAMATATALQSIYNQATSGTPALNDPLTGNTASNWSVYSNNGSTCAFTGGALHASATAQAGGALCPALASNFSNFAYQVKLTILKGDLAGLLFRFDTANNKAYFFVISPDSSYELFLLHSNSPDNGKILSSGRSSVIVPGLNQSNLLTVIVRGSSIYLYINKQYVVNLSDSTSSSGKIGVFGASNGTDSDVAFNDAEVWNL
jgi:hypothetical protein